MTVVQLKPVSLSVPKEPNLMNPSNDAALPIVELKDVCTSYGSS